ncbi:MAG: hypothetical protein CME06_11905 [Gemmatimonadetes bacterium]|nr:hypothetical protein [Gemmatimonadota bacterium]
MRLRSSFLLAVTILASALSPALAQRDMAVIELLEMQYNLDDAVRFLPEGPNGPHSTLSIVPDDHVTIQAAIDAAPASGHTILIRAGTYVEETLIDASRFDDLTIEGECGRLPVLDGSNGRCISISNPNDDTLTVKIRNLHLTNGTHGIDVRGSSSDIDAVVTTLHASRLQFTDLLYGIEAGNRTGDFRCNGDWGAVNADLLDQPITRVYIDRCTFLACFYDAINLWRANGAIVSNIILHSGGEGIHTTDLFDAVIANNFMMECDDIQCHLQYAGAVEIKNNIIVGGDESFTNYQSDGIVVAGAKRAHLPVGPEVHIDNNIFYGSQGAGVHVVGTSIVIKHDPCKEVLIPSRVRLRNNVFLGNAFGSEHYALHIVDARHNLLDDWVEHTLFHDNNGRHYDPTIDILGEGNIFDQSPLFSALPHRDSLLAMATAEEIRDIIMGFRPHNASPLIDAGNPGGRFTDRSYLAGGGPTNDIGVFGGPQAVPSPLHVGSRSTPCLSMLVDWSGARVYFDDPLFVEPGGDPLAASTRARMFGREVNLHWVAQGIDMRWVQPTALLSTHELGNHRLKVITVPE